MSDEKHPSGVPAITVARHMTYNSGNALECLWRAGLKSQPASVALEDLLRDLRTAKYHIEDEIARLEGKAG